MFVKLCTRISEIPTYKFHTKIPMYKICSFIYFKLFHSYPKFVFTFPKNPRISIFKNPPIPKNFQNFTQKLEFVALTPVKGLKQINHSRSEKNSDLILIFFGTIPTLFFFNNFARTLRSYNLSFLSLSLVNKIAC